jgi:hypothetical protein
MNSRNLLELARQGDIEAIATLLNRALQTKGIAAKVGMKDDCLYISLVADEVPPQKVFAPFIYQAILRLGVAPIRLIRVYGRQTGQDSPSWYQEMELENPDSAINPPVDQLSASKSTVIPSVASVPDVPDGVAMRSPSPSVAAEAAELQNQPAVQQNIRANLQGEIRGSLVAIGTNIQQSFYYVLQPDSHLGDRVDLTPLANRPQPRLRQLPVLLLPLPFPNLLDRQAELETALPTLQAQQPVEFYGQDGTGKTALLRHLAHHSQIVPSFPGGIIYLPVHHRHPADLLQLLFDAFHESDLPLKPTETEIRHALQNKQALVLLDDGDFSRNEFDELQNLLPDLTFLLASTEQKVWHRGHALHLQGLPLEHALTLVERELKRSLSNPERTAVEDLHLALDGHPLLLLQAAAMVRERRVSLEEVVQRMQPALPERSLVRQILAPMLKPQRSLLGLLAAFAGVALSADHARAITGIAETDTMLQGLQQQYLIQQTGSYYSINRASAEVLEQELDLSPWMAQALDHFMPWVEQHRMLPQSLLEESEALLHILDWAASAGRWSEVLHLGKILGSALALGRQWGAWEWVLQRQLQAARSLSDAAAEAWVQHQLGTRALCLDDTTHAREYLTEALQKRESLGDQSGAAVTRHNLSLLPAAIVPDPDPDPDFNPLPPMPSVQSRPSIRLWLGIAGLFLLSGLAGLLIGNLLRSPDSRTGQDPNAPSNPNGTSSPNTEIVTTAGLNFSANNLNFGRRPAGGSTLTQGLTLTNNSPKPITLNQVSLGGSNADAFTIAPDSCADGTVLDLGRSCNIRVSFNPRQAGFYQAEIDVAYTGANQPQRIPIQAAVTNNQEPSLGISTDRLRFGDQPVGTFSIPARITLTSNGAVPVRIANIDFNSDRDDFTVQRNTCPETLAPDRRCDLFVIFTPTQTGRRRADLLITHSATGSPLRVALRGSGTPANTAALRLSTTNLNFGNVAVGETSRVQTITVTNIGKAPLNINNLDLSGSRDDFSVDSNCWNRAIAPNNQCTIQVTFNPQSTGDRRASLTIRSNASNPLPSVLLRGNATGAVDKDPPNISQITAQPDPVIYNSPQYPSLRIEATVTDPSGVASVRVRYRFETNTDAGPFRVLDMQPIGGDRYVATPNIYGDSDAYKPILGSSGRIDYEIEATDKFGNRDSSNPQTVEANYEAPTPPTKPPSPPNSGAPSTLN